MKENYIDSYGCSPPNKLSRFLKKKEMDVVFVLNIKFKTMIVFLQVTPYISLLGQSYRNGFQICCSEFALSNDSIMLTFALKKDIPKINY